MTWQWYGWLILKATHLVLGFILFGVIYYLGFFTSRVVRELDAEERARIVPKVLPAYMHWLKWEAWWTVASGAALWSWKVWILGSFPDPTAVRTWALALGATITISIALSITWVVCPMQDRIAALSQTRQFGEDWHSLVFRSRFFVRLFSWLGIAVVVLMVFAAGA